ncbi:ATP-binding protein [Paratractidigestivibacter sp.]|uniref:ATP-binding protein n=2 Tax=Paratractidigestivibacter sp. TaxID=2847316 RepID=UPI002ABD4C86|nr:ATP-binding protein [Paratractidigestivibacter sp.]
MIKDTIFSPAFGNRPTYLVGRELVLDGLIAGLDSVPGSKERSTVLLGQRGSGKTVLLWELADRATEMGYVVASPTIVSDGMLARIVEKVQDSGGRYVSDVPHVAGGGIGAFGFEAGLEFSREVQETKSDQFKLTQLARKL